MKKDIPTEEKILKSAGEIFRSKGFAGARMQEIADKAGINKAMLHYYFRSKQHLFDKIFKDLLENFHHNIIDILNEENTWEKKIITLTEKLFTFSTANKDISIFLFNELHMNPKFLQEKLFKFTEIRNSLFFTQLTDDITKGKIIKIDPLQIFVHILSGVIFPVIAEPIISSVGDFDDRGFDLFMHQRKEIIPNILTKYLKNT